MSNYAFWRNKTEYKISVMDTLIFLNLTPWKLGSCEAD